MLWQAAMPQAGKARRRQEHLLNCQVPRAADQAISPALR
jgi:hypothetical protein